MITERLDHTREAGDLMDEGINAHRLRVNYGAATSSASRGATCRAGCLR